MLRGAYLQSRLLKSIILILILSIYYYKFKQFYSFLSFNNIYPLFIQVICSLIFFNKFKVIRLKRNSRAYYS